MKVTGFDGREHTLSFKKHRYKSRRTKHKSSLHLKARKLISSVLPYETVYEEVTLPGSKTNTTGLLYADFFLPNKLAIIEVHGQQHYEYSSFFYKTQADFLKSKRRDKKKKEWCELNDITLIILPYNEEEAWKTSIKELL